MASLGKKIGAVGKRTACITGYGTCCNTYVGDEVAIVAPTMRGLKAIWAQLSCSDFNEAKVRRVAIFPRERLTYVRSRKRTAAGKSEVQK